MPMMMAKASPWSSVMVAKVPGARNFGRSCLHMALSPPKKVANRAVVPRPVADVASTAVREALRCRRCVALNCIRGESHDDSDSALACALVLGLSPPAPRLAATLWRFGPSEPATQETAPIPPSRVCAGRRPALPWLQQQSQNQPETRRRWDQHGAAVTVRHRRCERPLARAFDPQRGVSGASRMCRGSACISCPSRTDRARSAAPCPRWWDRPD